MKTITYETMQQLLNDANAELMASFPKFANIGGIVIEASGFGGFNPTIAWYGTCGNSPDTAAEFAKALALAAELVEAMPCKGAKVTYY